MDELKIVGMIGGSLLATIVGGIVALACVDVAIARFKAWVVRRWPKMALNYEKDDDAGQA